MFCQQCGLKLPDGAKFCGVCGTPVQSESPSAQSSWTPQSYVSQHSGMTSYPVVTPPQKKKKGVRKGAVSVIVICSILAVAVISAGIYIAVGGLRSSVPEPSPTSSEKPTVNFDLTQYQDHGELSCGLIWVEQKTSSYDQAPKTQFAYFDADGNQKSEWFTSSAWEKSDFSNGLLVLKSPFNSGDSDGVCWIYDQDFTRITAMFVNIEMSGNVAYVNNFKEKYTISDVDNNGDIYAVGKLSANEEIGLYRINKDGVLALEVDSQMLHRASDYENMQRCRRYKEYYVVDFEVVSGVGSNRIQDVLYFALFDEQGKLAYQPKIGYGISSIGIASDNELNVIFRGKDKKEYSVKTDFDGNFLTEPLLVND